MKRSDLSLRPNPNHLFCVFYRPESVAIVTKKNSSNCTLLYTVGKRIKNGKKLTQEHIPENDLVTSYKRFKSLKFRGFVSKKKIKIY